MELTQAHLKECLDYDPLTGTFIWKYRPSCSKQRNTRFTGKEAGCTYKMKRKDGYARRSIVVDHFTYTASRLAWLYMTGSWPNDQIDHINHDSADNRFANLREVDSTENNKNRSKRRDNKSGVTGVNWRASNGNWRVYISIGGKQIHGGYFTSFEEAVARRKELEAQYNFHANHGAEKLAA